MQHLNTSEQNLDAELLWVHLPAPIGSLIGGFSSPATYDYTLFPAENNI